MKNIYNKSLIFFLILIITIVLPIMFFLIGVPAIVSNPQFILWVQDYVKESSNAELIIQKPVLKTSHRLLVSFKAESVDLIKNQQTLLSVENLNCDVSLKKIFEKKIILQKLGADNIFANINELQSLEFKKQKKSNQPLNYEIKWFKSDIYLKKCTIVYKTKDNVSVKVLARDLELTKQVNPKLLHFAILTDIEYDNQRFRLMFRDFDTIYIKNKKINVDDFKFIVGKSMVSVNGYIDEKRNYDFKVKSKNFDVKNVKNILDSNIIIPNGKEVLACFKDLNGSFDFNFTLTNENINGNVDVNRVNFKLIPVANLPITVTNGNIKLNSNEIKINDIKGFYGIKTANKFEGFGDVKDYTKTAKTTIGVTGVAENEFAKYISKIAKCNLSLKGLSQFALKINYDTSGKITVAGGAKIPRNSDLLIEGSSISSSKFDRALGIKLQMLGNEMSIEHLNYYISDFIATKGKPISKPLVTMNSKINLANGWIKELSFDIPNPLPSEFFNVLINQKVFRNGTFSGKLKYDNRNVKYPKIFGSMTVKDVSIRGQGLKIKNGFMTTNNNDIHLVADGRFRRTNYKFDGNIQNKILFPVIVKKVEIDVNELDVERLLQTFAPRKPLTEEQRKQFRARMAQMEMARSDVPKKYFEVEQKSVAQKTQNEEEQIKFEPNLVAIKECNFNVKKGQYKLINFGNLHAKLSLTEKGILEIKSNKFDFAEGISTLKIYCDMVKEKYAIRLGAKDVNSDIISASILNLPKEISGKSSALLEFNTDSNMKLNGRIQFAIQEGSIAKLGLVQYILNFASIFRNPIVMVSPSTLVDLVNIPEGTFKKISGDIRIKDDIIERMMIKSYSPQLSAFIIGRINLENFDSSLRIYTKFSGQDRGFAGFLRNISLNALAKRTTSSNLDEVSYYAAELSMLPKLETGEDKAQVFLTKVDGDIQTNNFISSLKKIK